jgi:hypothetical protein
MNEEAFNLSLRKFLKTFGVTAQRDIERAVQDALEAGTLIGTERLRARASLEIDGVPIDTVVEGEIILN